MSRLCDPLTDDQKRLLREYYRGKRTPQHLEVFRIAEGLKEKGMIPHDGLKYPKEAQPATLKYKQTPMWVWIQSHRVAMQAILLPEAERMLTPTGPYATLEPMTRYKLFKLLSLPRSGKAYNKIAPYLTEEQAIELTDMVEAGERFKGGCAPWFPLGLLDKKFQKYPYPPAEFDPYLNDIFYDKYCRDYEGLLGEPEPVLWNVRWSRDLLTSKPRKPSTEDPPAPESTSSPTDTPEPDSAENQEDLGNELLNLFED